MSSVTVDSAKLWYTGKKMQKPVSIRQQRRATRKKRTDVAGISAKAYIKTIKKAGEDSESEEDQGDGGDLTIRQTLAAGRFVTFLARKVG